MHGYCLRCKKMVKMSSPHIHHTKTGRAYEQGKCPNCGAKVNRFISVSSAKRSPKKSSKKSPKRSHRSSHKR